MKAVVLTFAALLFMQLAEAIVSPEAPDQSEEFQSFFARITRGGGFRGIYVTPTVATQNIFLQKIKKGYWVGANDRFKKRLADSGVNLWGDWYLQQNAFKVIFNTPLKEQHLFSALNEQIKLDQAECAPICPSAEKIVLTNWKDLDYFSKQSFLKAFVFKLDIFGGKTLLDQLAKVYNFPASEVFTTTKVKILSNANFREEVRKLGYEGEIYFRGITSPDPQDAKNHIILLDEENLFKYSPFDRPLLKTLETVGIITHELSHVFQDLKGRSLGLDVEVTSAESALLLEGSAEHLAETAMLKASELEQSPSALGLFATEQAVEIVYREGNETSGNLFPYTIGLPFSAALYDQVGENNHERLTVEILKFLGQRSNFQDWLSQDLFKQ